MPPLGRSPDTAPKQKTEEQLKQDAEIRQAEERVAAVMISLTTGPEIIEGFIFKREVRYRLDSRRAFYECPGEPDTMIEAWVKPNIRRSEKDAKFGASTLFTRVGRTCNGEFIATGEAEARASYLTMYGSADSEFVLDGYDHPNEGLDHDGRMQRLQDIEDTLAEIVRAEQDPTSF